MVGIYEGFKPGDRVVLVKPYTYKGKPFSSYTSGLGPEVGTYGTVQNDAIQSRRFPGAIGVKWDGFSGKWTDVECIGFPGPTDEELAEVYEILGVDTKTEEV